MTRQLTDKQQLILNYIREKISESGCKTIDPVSFWQKKQKGALPIFHLHLLGIRRFDRSDGVAPDV